MGNHSKQIQDILEHPIYTQMTSGIKRTDGILGELKEASIITEEIYNELLGRELPMDNVAQVLNIINTRKV